MIRLIINIESRQHLTAPSGEVMAVYTDIDNWEKATMQEKRVAELLKLRFEEYMGKVPESAIAYGETLEECEEKAKTEFDILHAHRKPDTNEEPETS